MGRRHFETERWKVTVHFNGDLENAELSLRETNSANQLSIHGPDTDWCDELAQQILSWSVNFKL